MNAYLFDLIKKHVCVLNAKLHLKPKILITFNQTSKKIIEVISEDAGFHTCIW